MVRNTWIIAEDLLKGEMTAYVLLIQDTDGRAPTGSVGCSWEIDLPSLCLGPRVSRDIKGLTAVSNIDALSVKAQEYSEVVYCALGQIRQI